MSAPRITGFGHIDFTVADGERSSRWWSDVLGFRLVERHERSGFKVWSMYRSGVAVGLVVHERPGQRRFDECSVGLDHFALRVRDRAALDEWVDHLNRLGIPHSGPNEELGGPIITVRDPDNVQIELSVFERESLQGTVWDAANEGKS